MEIFSDIFMVKISNWFLAAEFNKNAALLVTVNQDNSFSHMNVRLYLDLISKRILKEIYIKEFRR
jgi:hypothetical protein